MAGLNDKSWQIIGYDAPKFDFRAPIIEALGLPSGFSLTKLHKEFPPSPLVTKENDSLSEAHARVYRNIGHTAFFGVYHSFLRSVVQPLFDEPIYVQKIPSFRFQYPVNRAVGSFHRDGDEGYNHQAAAVNFWVPLVDTSETNTLWIEDGERGMSPIVAKLGHVVVFDAADLLHGNIINETHETRCSFDIRAIPHSRYKESSRTSSNTGVRLNVGGYYEDLENLI